MSTKSRRLAWITGASGGLGRATAHGLARQGFDLVLAGRSAERHQEVLREARALGADVRHVALDLSDLGSVAAAARPERPIDALVLNAGVAGVRGLTADGFELAFGVNHLAHFLLTRLLMPALRAGQARVVTVGSRAHFDHDHIDWDAVRAPTASLTGWTEYARSKLANLLTSRALARMLEGTGITTHAVHPGRVATALWRPLPAPMRALMTCFSERPEVAAKTTLHCVLSPEARSGSYYEREALAPHSPVVDDTLLQAELIERSDSWAAPFLRDGELTRSPGRSCSRGPAPRSGRSPG